MNFIVRIKSWRNTMSIDVGFDPNDHFVFHNDYEYIHCDKSRTYGIVKRSLVDNCL